MKKIGKKINYLPLTICLIIGIVISYLMYLVSRQVFISVLFGIIGLIVSILIYSLNLSNSYNYWQIDDREIQYNNYDTTAQKVQAIILPLATNRRTLKFSEISSIALVIGKGMEMTAGIGSEGAIDASAYVVDSALQHFYSPYYLMLKLKDGRKVDLDLSKNKTDKANVERLIKEIELKTNLKAKLVKQSL